MWLSIFAFFLSLLCYCMLVLSLPFFPSLSTFLYLSFSAYSRPLESVISAVGGNEWMIFISLSPLCYCCFGAVRKRQRGKQRLYSFSALGTWACNPWSMHGRGGKENTEAQTERCDIVRLKRRARAHRKCDTDGARRQTDRQTREEKDGQWCHMEKEGWVEAGRGTTATGVTHFSYYSLLWLFWRSVCEPIFFSPYLQNSDDNKNFRLFCFFLM